MQPQAQPQAFLPASGGDNSIGAHSSGSNMQPPYEDDISPKMGRNKITQG